MKIKLLDYGYEKEPVRAHYNDAGIDVYAHLDKPKFIPANSSTKIPLGFGLELPDGFVAFVCPRSGLSSKGLTCELAPIDSGYRGEIHAIVTNTTSSDMSICNGDKIAQLVIMPCVLIELVKELGEERNTAGFGSTGLH